MLPAALRPPKLGPIPRVLLLHHAALEVLATENHLLALEDIDLPQDVTPVVFFTPDTGIKHLFELLTPIERSELPDPLKRQLDARFSAVKTFWELSHPYQIPPLNADLASQRMKGTHEYKLHKETAPLHAFRFARTVSDLFTPLLNSPFELSDAVQANLDYLSHEGYPVPENEVDRLRLVHALGIMDSADDPALEELTQYAAQVCETKSAAITIIDAYRQWFKASYNLPVRQTPREDAFCPFTMEKGAYFEVPNATKDPRFVDNALVTGPLQLRAYAGVPLEMAPGMSLGALCVLHDEPNQLSATQRQALHLIAKQIIDRIEYDYRLWSFLVVNASLKLQIRQQSG